MMGLFFEEELRQAAEERDALLKELADALQDPRALFEGIADGVAEGYKRDWRDFNAHMNAETLEGRFRAGMILGQLLVDVLSLLTGMVGVGKVGGKMATKLPRLVKFAKSVKLKPAIRSKPHSGVPRGGGGGVPETPGETSRSEHTTPAEDCATQSSASGAAYHKATQAPDQGPQGDSTGISRTLFRQISKSLETRSFG